MKRLLDPFVIRLKRVLYARRGEPYKFAGRTLRFAPGTRPVRTKYRTSPNDNTRNDALQVELVRDRLQESDTAIDIGAHAGQYGVLMSARCGQSGRVVCFEPDPDAIARLERNVRLNPSLKALRIVPAACSDTRGRAIFFTQGGNSQSSLARSAVPVARETTQIEVETVRLDDWWAEHGEGRKPALIKIDTEGAEVNVLRGMMDLLASDALVVCELHPYAWEEFGVGLSELEQLAASTGRTLRWLDGSGKMQDPVRYGTVVLERKEMRGTRRRGDEER